MQPRRTLLCTAAIAAMIAATPASADTLKSGVAFNNGIGKKTATQPADGVEVAYQITLQGGDLDGCTVDVVEQLYGRDEGGWGIFDIAGDVKCDRGDFSYTSSGAWDGKGFHAAGDIEDGSGSGDFEGVSGRVAQLRRRGADAGDGTFDISYDLVFEHRKLSRRPEERRRWSARRRPLPASHRQRDCPVSGGLKCHVGTKVRACV